MRMELTHLIRNMLGCYDPDWRQIRRLSRLLLVLWVAFTMALPPTFISPQAAYATNRTSPPDPPEEDEPEPEDECGPDSFGSGGDEDDDDCDDDDDNSVNPDAPEPEEPAGEPPATSCDPIYFSHGSVKEDVTDLYLSGPTFDWSLTRMYSSLGGGFTSFGNRWGGGPTYRRLTDDALDPSSDDKLYMQSPHSKIRFTGYPDTPVVFEPHAGGYLQLEHDTANDQYVLTDQRSNLRLTFFDESVSNTGKLKEESTLQWHADGKAGFEYSYSGGKISQITSPDGQDYNIVFSYTGDLISKVEIKDASNDVLEQVEYTYYDDVTSPSTDLGTSLDLVQVKVSRRATKDTGSALSIVRYTQYRYHASSKIKAIYNHDDIQRIIDGVSGISSPEDILTKADTYGTPQVKEFASRQFEHYTADVSTAAIATPFSGSENLNTTYGVTEVAERNLVKSETIGGCGACGGGTGVKKSYFHVKLIQPSTLDQNEVRRIVVEDTEDADGNALYRILYGVNHQGRLLRKVFIDDPTGTPTYWCTSNTMQTTGKPNRVAEKRMPSAHNVTTAANLKKFLDPYDSGTPSWSNDSDTLNASDGLIYVYNYNGAGMRVDSKVKKGKNGTEYFLRSVEYGDGDGDSTGEDNDNDTLVVARYTYPTKTTTRADGKKIEYSYTFWDLDDRLVKTRTTTLPAIPTAQNGSGSATTLVNYYDEFGRLRWKVNGEGYITYYAHNPVTGARAYAAADVDPSSPGSDVTSGSSGNWDAWTIGDADGNKPTRDSGLPTALNLARKTYYDDLGRVRKVQDPAGDEHYWAYENDRSLFFQYWDSSSSETLLPVQATEFPHGAQIGESYAVKAGYSSISTSSSEPTGFSSEPGQSDYVAWIRYTYGDVDGRLKFADRYHDIPSSGDGTLGTNFYRSVYQYDAADRLEYRINVVSGSSASDRKEQVTQYVYDVLDRVIEVKQGVSGDSAANSHNMTDDYDTYPTLQTTGKIEYDAGGVGDGDVTKTKSYHDTGTNDFTGTNFKYTYRGHLRGVEPFYMNGSTETAVGPYTVLDLEWRGMTSAAALYDAAPTWSSVLTGDGYTDYASSTSTDRRTLSETSYDDLGRPYRTKRYKIDASAGTGSDHFLGNLYYDRDNRVVGTSREHAAASEFAYDGAGRLYQSRTVLDLESTKYSSGEFQYRAPTPHPSLGSMTGGDDWVLALNHSVYDDLLATERHRFSVNHDDAVSASRGIDLSGNDDYVRSSTYAWYDAAERIEAAANYGSGDTAAGAGTWKYASVPTRPSTAPSTSSNTRLVSLFAYNADSGRLETATDSAGTVTKYFYDDLGRQTYSAANYDNFNASSESGTGDATDKSKDRVTKMVRNGFSRLTQLVALDANADGSLSDNQTTTYLYEDARFAALATNVIYADSSDTTSAGSDQVKLQYNVDGSVNKRTDQRGTVLDYTYTNRRQLELVKATTLGGADGHVQSIKRTYDDLARLEKVTSYSGSDGTGTVRNEVQFELNDLGQITTSYQSHEGAVSTMSTPNVGYAYDTTAASNVFSRQHRLESVTYPDGRVLFYDYDSSNADYSFNRLSLVRKLRETNSGGTELAVYDYNGTGRPVLVDYPEPDLKLDYFQGTSGTYAGLDRFGRIKDQYWDGYNSTADVDRVAYAYDDASNRTYRDIDSAIYASNDKDQAYTYDGLHRLVTSDEGTLSGTTISGTPTKEEDWTLDALGNWSGFVTKTSGTTDLNQSRTTNDVNEITNVTETVGSSWVTPAYDAAGNMTTISQPAQPTTGFTATYDAFNRLVKLVDGANTVAEYEYDGLDRRIVKSIYSGGSLDHRRHVYYSTAWQALEIRKDVSGTEDTDPLEQYAWHPYYVDALLLRDYDADVDGTSVRHYYTQDANFNVTAVTDDSGGVLERYQYRPYGEVLVLDANFATDGDGLSDIENEITFTGRRFDAESGLYYFRNRLHHAQLGSFVSRDPIGYGGRDSNLFRYVHSRPTSAVDPSGLIEPMMVPSGGYGGGFANPMTGATSDNPNFGDTPEARRRAAFTIDFGSSIAPGVSDVRDVAEVISGRNFGIGRPLSRTERITTGVLMVAPVVSGALWRRLFGAANDIPLGAADDIPTGGGRRGPGGGGGGPGGNGGAGNRKCPADDNPSGPNSAGAAGNADTPPPGNPVLVDSSAVPDLKKDPTAGGRIGPNDTPFVSNVSRPEMRNRANQNPRFFVPRALDDLPVYRTPPSPDTSINVRNLLGDGPGVFGDGIIGGQALESGMPLITNDRDLGKAVNTLGGEVRINLGNPD